MVYNATFRNIIGDILTLIISIIINLLTIPVIICIEGIQCNWGKKFDWEYGDIIRRIFISIVGSAIQIGIITEYLY